MTIDDGARLGGASPVEPETVDDVLRSPSAGGKVIRGGALRAVGYGAAIIVGTATAALLLRHLGVDDFGRYVTVTALLGIVAALTDSGLTAVGNREMATRKAGTERDHLLANLLVIRVAATVVGVLGAVAFALIVGYPESMVAGTLVGGIGILLLNAQTMMTMPMWVDLRIGSIVVLDFLKQVLTLVFVALLVALGAGLFPFYAVQIPVGIALILVTVLVLRRVDVLVPRLDIPTARMLVRETLPLAVAFTMSIVYFRVLVILVSLVSTPEQTGLYGTSFRIFETLLAAPALVLGVALPLLSVAGVEDEPRFRYAIQRMTETALLAGGLLVIAIGVLAEPAIRIIGGPSYLDAVPVLQVQVVALLFVFLGQTWQLALVAARGQRIMAISNGLALVVVIALGLILIPQHGALGAAWAAVVAEAVLTATLWIGLRVVRPGVAPDLRQSWKMLVALAAGTGVALLGQLPPVVEAPLACGAFVAVAFALRAVPSEILEALHLRT